MSQAVRDASTLVLPGGCLAVMTTEAELKQLRVEEFTWNNPIQLPGSDHRVLALTKVQANSRSAK